MNSNLVFFLMPNSVHLPGIPALGGEGGGSELASYAIITARFDKELFRAKISQYGFFTDWLKSKGESASDPIKCHVKMSSAFRPPSLTAVSLMANDFLLDCHRGQWSASASVSLRDGFWRCTAQRNTIPRQRIQWRGHALQQRCHSGGSLNIKKVIFQGKAVKESCCFTSK